MPAKYNANRPHGRVKQRGAILLIMLVIMIIGVAAILVRSLSLSSVKSARQTTTAAALAQAKAALLGYAVSDSNRPGELPCPDFDNDGMITIADYSGSDCKSLIGRLPWKTLGLPDLRDGSGEHLWYALSDPFHASGSTPINSNTKGTLLVYGPDGTTPQTQAGYSAVAVIFSPGSPVGTQSRNTTTQQSDAANYLDIANSINNASASGPFISGTESSTFNDQLLYITTQDLMPLVEKRVAAEVKKALSKYYLNSSVTASNRYYPWADSIIGTVDYNSDYGLNWGWLPDDAYVNSSTAAWGTASPPSWFFDNHWYAVIFYSVARNYTAFASDCIHDGNGVNNSGCISNTLYVDGVPGVQALFIMPGTPIGTLTRSNNNLADYLDDPQNNPQDTTNHTYDRFITPTSQAGDRDRLYKLP